MSNSRRWRELMTWVKVECKDCKATDCDKYCPTKENNDSGEKKDRHSYNCPSLKGKPVCTCGHLQRYGNDDDYEEQRL